MMRNAKRARSCRGVAVLLLAVFAAFVLFENQAFAAERAVDLELVLAADISGSMDLEEATLQRQGFIAAIQDPDVVAVIQRGGLGRIAVTYMEWAGHSIQNTLVGWTEISDAASARAFARAIERSEPRTALWTSISAAIGRGAGSFEDNGFEAPRRVIDISGDGPNNSGEYVVDARDRAVAAGIVINGLPIVNDRPAPDFNLPALPNLDLYYEDCVIGGTGSFLIVANGFQDFARAIRRKLILEIAGRSPPRFLLHRVAERERPPCDAGEKQLRGLMQDFD